MTTMTHSNPAIDATIQRAYRAIELDPQVLLETDGGPVGMKADLYVARLYGFDDQLDAEMFLDEVLTVIRRPIAADFTFLDETPTGDPIRVAPYRLQSGYALAHVAADLLPPNMTYGDDFRAKILCLRYRRQPAQR